jgi:hypothetical protein
VDALVSDALQQRRNAKREQKLLRRTSILHFVTALGRVAEWFKAAVLKFGYGHPDQFR